jgi:hypothetical protein
VDDADPILTETRESLHVTPEDLTRAFRFSQLSDEVLFSMDGDGVLWDFLLEFGRLLEHQWVAEGCTEHWGDISLRHRSEFALGVIRNATEHVVTAAAERDPDGAH